MTAGVGCTVDTPEGPAVIRAAYVAGCDGATSAVRTAAARQAACYRAGRVLLAGDAAHIHYPAWDRA